MGCNEVNFGMLAHFAVQIIGSRISLDILSIAFVHTDTENHDHIGYLKNPEIIKNIGDPPNHTTLVTCDHFVSESWLNSNLSFTIL